MRPENVSDEQDKDGIQVLATQMRQRPRQLFVQLVDLVAQANDGPVQDRFDLAQD